MDMSSVVPNIYVHLPFCRRKCLYCDFYSVGSGPEDAARRQAYLQAVVRELRRLLERDLFHVKRPPATLYLGGGTPSLVEPDLFSELAAALGVSPSAKDETEFSVEVNPESATPERLIALRRLGANRFSCGVQSFSDDNLRLLGRIHDADASRSAIQRLRSLPELRGASVGLDLIFAIPGQTLDAWRRDLELAVSLGPDHISAYGLTYYEGTRLLAARDKGALEVCGEELEARMFETAHAVLTSAGYEHYEISNYARPGHACRHNQAVWRGEDYLGLGAAAHSRVAGRRWSNPPDVDAYCHAIESGELPRQFAEEPTQGPSWRAERLMLGLRTCEGVDLSQWPAAERGAFLEDHERDIAELVQEDMAILDGVRLALTLKGWLLHDAILRRLI